MNKINISLIIGICLIGIFLVVVFFRGEKVDVEKPLIKDTISTSLNASYQQYAYLSLRKNENLSSVTNLESILEDKEQYKNCSGSLSFLKKGIFDEWNYHSSCGEQNDNMNNQIFSLNQKGLYFRLFEEFSEGYMLIAEDFYKGVFYITFLNHDWQILWEDSFSDNQTPSSIIFYNAAYIDNNYYILGYAEGNVEGDFKEVRNDQDKFYFLMKYDQSGQRKSVINLNSLGTIDQMVAILNGSSGILYIDALDSVYVLNNEKELRKIKLLDKISVMGLANNNIYGIKDKRNANKNGELIEEFYVFDLNGQEKFHIDLSNLKECNNDSKCTIDSIESINDFYVLDISNQLYFIDSKGNFFKKIDYTPLNSSDVDADVVGIFSLENSYCIISLVEDNQLYVREYDFEHNLIYEKNYEILELKEILNTSNKTSWNFDNHTLQITNLIKEDVSSIVSITLKE